MPREDSWFEPTGAEPLADKPICVRLPVHLDAWLRRQTNRSAVIRAGLTAWMEQQEQEAGQ